MKKLFAVLIVLFISILTGCGQEDQRSIELQPYTLAELSKVDLSKVTKINIKSNEDGEKVAITDQVAINKWIENMKDAYFTPDVVQEKKTTEWDYELTLYEDNKKVFQFFPNYIDDIYFKPDEKVMQNIDKLYNS